MGGDLPAGTVTFLFTDVEGSTALLDELGAGAYAEALAEHRRLLRDAFGRHGGVEVDTQGDAFLVAFPTAPGAVEAAREGQQALAGGPIRVRMGLHTGTPLVTEEGYVGVDVHRGARIAAVGHGGQVLLSQSTRELVDADVRDLGLHRLKDLGARERIFQLGGDGFPPLRSLNRSNLPVQSTPFLGREQELAEVLALARGPGRRLLTLTGAGGSGKTRLALQAAAMLSDDYAHGVWWVPLAVVHDERLVIGAAERAVGASVPLAEHVGDRALLLLLDNFEQVVGAAPDFADLLSSCPNLGLLVTSREALRLSGEQEYPVPPFAHQEGVGFFVARARATRPDFEPDEAVEEICRRLDDLPLALELAAARVKSLPTKQILERLSERLTLLTGGARDLPERQRTLRDTIAWSHDLLTEEERRLFRRLSVFAGGCTLEAAEAVCAADVDTLASLVDKSLTRLGDDRYGMLETIREYAGERLEESGEAAEVRRGHADFFLALAESANLSPDRMGQGNRYELVRPEADNLRAAFDAMLAAGEVELAGSLLVALELFWVSTNPHEGGRRLDALLEREDELSPPLHARAVRARGGMTYIVGDFEEGTRWHERALDEFRRLGDDRGVAGLLMRLAVEAKRTGDTARAKALCEEGLALDQGPVLRAEALDILGNVAFFEGRGDEALELLEESARLTREAGVPWFQSVSLLSRGEVALRLGRPQDAAPSLREGLEVAVGIGDRQWIFYGLTLLAWAAAAEGRPEDAGRLWGALEADAERAPVGQWEFERDDYCAHVVSATPEFERGYDEGRRLSLDEALRRALRVE